MLHPAPADFCTWVAPLRNDSAIRNLSNAPPTVKTPNRPLKPKTDRSPWILCPLREVPFLGLKGVVVGQGDSYEEVLSGVRSAIHFHIETFGEEVLQTDPPVLEAFVAEAGIAI